MDLSQQRMTQNEPNENETKRESHSVNPDTVCAEHASESAGEFDNEAAYGCK